MGLASDTSQQYILEACVLRSSLSSLTWPYLPALLAVKPIKAREGDLQPADSQNLTSIADCPEIREIIDEIS